MQKLFSLIAELKSRGITIITITHKIDEVFQVADRVSVLRDRTYIGTKPIRELDHDRLRACAGTAAFPFGTLSAAECRETVRELAQRLSRLEVRDMVVMDGTAYEPGF